VINSGTCFRTPDGVLAGWRDELGVPWATGLDEHFEALERDLRVQPVDPATAGRNAELVRAGAEAIGASNGPLSRNAGPVTCCGSCPLGCAIDAKRAMHVSELPQAVAAGARVRAGARVDRVLVESGRAAGVACTTARGQYEVRSRAVVLAAGALGTPELLLRQGLGNSSGQVGRNLRMHPACWVAGLYEEPVNGWDGVMQSWVVDEWQDRGLFLEATFSPLPFGIHWLRGAGERFKEQVENYGRMAILGVHLSDHESSGRVTIRGGRLRVSYDLARSESDVIRFGVARAAQILFAAGAVEAYPGLQPVPVLAPGDEGPMVEHARYGPEALRLEAFHPMGTTRMGAESRTSVVAPSGETHDVPGLYAADASILPTSLGVNPMLTIMACAREIARGLAGRLA